MFSLFSKCNCSLALLFFAALGLSEPGFAAVEYWQQYGIAVGAIAGNLPSSTGTLIMPEVVRVSQGLYRMYYSARPLGQPGGDIWVAESADASTWQVRGKVLAGIGNADGQEYVVNGPSLQLLLDGRWRLYYAGSPAYDDVTASPRFQIFSAVSTDGINFTREGVRIARQDFDSTALMKSAGHGRVRRLANGDYMAYISGKRGNNQVGVFMLHSSDGITFDTPQLLIPDAHDPVIVQVSGQYLMYADPSLNQGVGTTAPAGVIASSPDGVVWNISPDPVNFSDRVGNHLNFGGQPAFGDLGAIVLENGNLRLFSNYDIRNIAYYDRAIGDGTLPIAAPTCSLSASPPNIPSGGQSTLTASCDLPPSSFSWSANAGFTASANSGTVSPATTTTYTVAGTNAKGVGNVASVTVTVASAPPVAPLSRRGGIDLDGNGKSALLLRATDNTQMRVGRLVNGQFQFTTQSDPGPGYRLLAVADFDGNGKSDLAFQDITQAATGFGLVHVWPDFRSSGDYVLRNVKLAWIVEAVGDLDGDGFADMSFRFRGDDGVPNDTGVSYVWFQKTGGTYDTFRKRGGAPLNWTLVGAADVNGDGAADMVYVSPAGQVRVLVATAGRSCANFSAGTLPAGYTPLAVADFSGGRRADLLLRNLSTGAVALLQMDGTGLALPPSTADPNDLNAACTGTAQPIAATTTILPIADPSWQFYAYGDYNGDGIFDVLWRQPGGTLVLWQLNANHALPTVIANVGTSPSGFDVVHPPSTPTLTQEHYALPLANDPSGPLGRITTAFNSTSGHTTVSIYDTQGRLTSIQDTYTDSEGAKTSAETTWVNRADWSQFSYATDPAAIVSDHEWDTPSVFVFWGMKVGDHRVIQTPERVINRTAFAQTSNAGSCGGLSWNVANNLRAGSTNPFVWEFVQQTKTIDVQGVEGVPLASGEVVNAIRVRIQIDETNNPFNSLTGVCGLPGNTSTRVNTFWLAKGNGIVKVQ